SRRRLPRRRLGWSWLRRRLGPQRLGSWRLGLGPSRLGLRGLGPGGPRTRPWAGRVGLRLRLSGLWLWLWLSWLCLWLRLSWLRLCRGASRDGPEHGNRWDGRLLLNTCQDV